MMSCAVSVTSHTFISDNDIISLVRFEVAMNDAVAVDVLKGKNGLSKVRPGHVQRKAANVLQQRG